MTTPICRHCKQGKCNRPRGLCWSCYYTPGVKELYPPTSKFARRGVGNFSGAAKPASFPTPIEPGKDKEPVLAGRAARGENLWHPDDAKTTYPDYEENSSPDWDADCVNLDDLSEIDLTQLGALAWVLNQRRKRGSKRR